MNVEPIVVEFYGDRLAGIAHDEAPDGWEVITLHGGPYDGANFIRPDDQPEMRITIPVSFLQPDGTAWFARYKASAWTDRAEFAELVRLQNDGQALTADELESQA